MTAAYRADPDGDAETLAILDPAGTTAPPDYPRLAGWREGALILIEDAARYRQPTAETLQEIVRIARLGLQGPDL